PTLSRFPYTTLFRSLRPKLVVQLEGGEPPLLVGEVDRRGARSCVFLALRLAAESRAAKVGGADPQAPAADAPFHALSGREPWRRSEEHTSELQSREN